MATNDVKQLIEQYRQTPKLIEKAIEGIDPLQVGRRRSSEWTPLEILHHVVDFEIINGGRLRLILSRDGAPLPSAGQHDLLSAAPPSLRSPAKSLGLFRAHVEATAEWLAVLTPAAWQRAGDHEEFGRYPIDEWIRRRIEHAQQHADQIREAAAPTDEQA